MHDKDNNDNIVPNSNSNVNCNISGNSGVISGDAVLLENSRSGNAFIACNGVSGASKATRVRAAMNSTNYIGLSGKGSVNSLI